MQTKLIMQKNKKNTLADAITASFERKPKKIYLFFGNLKENGFKIIEDELFDNKIKPFIVIGIDKKNTTRNMLDDLLSYTNDIYVYSNNSSIEFNSNICIFEYLNEVVMYLSACNMSENGLIEDVSIYTEIVYDLKQKAEKDAYKAQLKVLIKELEIEPFLKLTKDKIDELIETKEIFSTRQYNHNVKSISQLLENTQTNNNVQKEMSKQEIDDVYVSDVSIPKIDLSDIEIDLNDIDFSQVNDFEDKTQKDVVLKQEKDNFDIDVSNQLNTQNFNQNEQVDNEEIDIDKNSEFYDESLNNIEFDESETLDINNLLFSKADIRLQQPVKESSHTDDTLEEVLQVDNEEEIVQGRKVNLNNITNLIFQLPSKTSKGQDLNTIKIPNYIRNMIPEFFELNENGINLVEKGVKYKIRNIIVEIVDVKNGVKYNDTKSKIVFKNGQSYITIISDNIKNIDYEENDIIRVIKLDSNVYHLEIIPSTMQEYKLWNKLCNQKFKSSTRRFGMM